MPLLTEEHLSVLSALHVMTTERKALENLEDLYRTNKSCQHNLAQTITTISETCRNHGKVIVCGIGKSGKIGQKIVATLNSLGITSIFLHPSEALHGDLGMIKEVRIMSLICLTHTNNHTARCYSHDHFLGEDTRAASPPTSSPINGPIDRPDITP